MTDPLALLLCERSAALRYRVLAELMDVPPDDPELHDLGRQREVEAAELDAGSATGVKELSWALCRYSYQGVDRSHWEVAAIAERVFDSQAADGSFPLNLFRRGRRESVYSMAPLQVALPLRGLAAAGYATDARAERAYDWLLSHQLDDGAWPMGMAHGQPGFIAGYRKLPGSKGCRATTEGVLACLVLHPDRSRAPYTRAALDRLLQRETRDEWALGTEVARLTGREPAAGFVTFYARFDLAFLLDLASRAGASLDDARVADLVEFLMDRRGQFGLWEHPAYPELSRWLTFDILSSLRRLRSGAWSGLAPRVPFRAYPTHHRRF
ncbi:prenyltransferase/squalene oxidase repeat-containing protein [Tenggerimyces flavus]|uniref:Squalene cyclase C-terminal domain-containing protein n=1 Tax=Tenggerimyces flavus TaxID=1708749 RepID=A0ABV7YMN9_9ACTN|nr:hypothetical protein [Tenggerimyces flavus]MBM7789571.1 hypothetical protein [Tenggerimyces flavus]